MTCSLVLCVALGLLAPGTPPEMLASQAATAALRLAPGPGLSIEGLGALRAEAAPAEGRLRLVDPTTGVAVELETWVREADGATAVGYSGWVHNEGSAPVTLGELRAVDLGLGLVGAGDRYRYEPLAYSAEQWYGSAFWGGPDWTRVGKDWQHSGTEVSSCRTFVAPRAGRVTVTGHVRKGDTKGGDGIRAFVRMGATTLFEAEIGPADATGAEHSLVVDLAEGDMLRFVLHRRGEITCDTTYWDPRVQYEDGQAYVASESFGDQPGVWRYDLERDLAEDVSAPVLHVPDTRFVWSAHALAAGQTLALGTPLTDSDSRLLPCYVYTGETAKASLVVAPASPGLWSLRAHRGAKGGGHLVLSCAAPGGALDLAPGESIPFPAVVLAAVAGDWTTARDAVWSDQPKLPLRPPTSALGLVGLVAHDDTPVTPVEAPTALEVAREGGTVRLTWTAPSEAGRTLVLRDGRPIGTSGTAGFADLAVSGAHPRYAVAAAEGYALSSPVETWEPGAPPAATGCVADLASLVEADWEGSDAAQIAGEGYLAAAETSLTAAEAAIDRRADGHAAGMEAAAGELRSALESVGAPTRATARTLYLTARWLRRDALLSDPLLDLGEVLFVKRQPANYSHLVMQYFGWRARPGGGLYALSSPGRDLTTRALAGDSLRSGSVLAPDLSWDGERVVFSYSSCTQPDAYYHLFEVGADGSGLRQLTSGVYEDLTPAYLPGGDIALVSTRRKGHARCFGAQFGPDWHVYTLARLFRETGEVRTLSFHETNEWFPSVLPDGTLSYARWDYVDRHAVLHQNLWRTNPDGTSPVTLYGNHTENPHCSFEARVVPGTSKLLCTATPHHSITGGSLILVDTNTGYDGPAPVERLTPEVPFPESEGLIASYYASPWPLSEDLYLCAYSPSPLLMEPAANEPNALGLYALDRWGNRELLYRDPVIGCQNPIPLRPRPEPPVRQSLLPEGAPNTGTFLLQDVGRGMPGVAPGTVKSIRIVQVLPKVTPVADDPPIGLAGQEPARAVLGTVPVQPDGSACFEAPARMPLLFQALDGQGRALQTMRSETYLQPGERATCIGCHEPRNTAEPARDVLAAHLPPSAIEPGPDGARPFSYPLLVQPILDRHCVSCHGDEAPAAGMPLTATAEGVWSRSYLSLTGGQSFWQDSTNLANAQAALVPRYGGWNPVHRTEPGGAYGALGSRLMSLLEGGHEGVTLEPSELARIALWIDCNSVFYGTYDRADQQAQLVGATVAMPSIQ